MLLWGLGVWAAFELLRDRATPHNAEVLLQAQKLEAEGWDVTADLPGWRMPELINGMRPDILAERAGRFLAIEVETSRSVDRAHSVEQDDAFRTWSRRSSRRLYRQIVVELDA